MKRVTKAEVAELAASFKVPVAKAHAFIKVESGTGGFFTDWKGQSRIKIQFEPHYFKKLLPKAIFNEIVDLWNKYVKQVPLTEEQKTLLHNWQVVCANKVDVQLAEWQAFNAAFAIHPETAMLSASWGAMQVMGAEHKKAGYATVAAMVDAFKASEYNQVKGGLNFCATKPGLLAAIQASDWHKAARLYNGSQYKKHGYHIKLAEAEEAYKA